MKHFLAAGTSAYTPSNISAFRSVASRAESTRSERVAERVLLIGTTRSRNCRTQNTCVWLSSQKHKVQQTCPWAISTPPLRAVFGPVLNASRFVRLATQTPRLPRITTIFATWRGKSCQMRSEYERCLPFVLWQAYNNTEACKTEGHAGALQSGETRNWHGHTIRAA